MSTLLYELGASITDDVEPIYAVLNNIISREVFLPKHHLGLKERLVKKLDCTEESILYGGFRFTSKLEHADESKIEKYAKEGILGSDLRINQILYTPVAIGRVQKVLIEALITNRLDLKKDEWNILVEERDVPFAHLAIKDFEEMFNHLLHYLRTMTGLISL